MVLELRTDRHPPRTSQMRYPLRHMTPPLSLIIPLILYPQTQDNGIPSLSSSGLLVITFVNESLSCSVGTDPVYVHTVPRPGSNVFINQISCQQSNTDVPTFTYSLNGTINRS